MGRDGRTNNETKGPTDWLTFIAHAWPILGGDISVSSRKLKSQLKLVLTLAQDQLDEIHDDYVGFNTGNGEKLSLRKTKLGQLFG